MSLKRFSSVVFRTFQFSSTTAYTTSVRRCSDLRKGKIQSFDFDLFIAVIKCSAALVTVKKNRNGCIFRKTEKTIPRYFRCHYRFWNKYNLDTSDMLSLCIFERFYALHLFATTNILSLDVFCAINFATSTASCVDSLPAVITKAK